jgi:hypothetical protein
MPTDPAPEGQAILDKPLVKPFPQPPPGGKEKDEHAEGEEGTAPDSLVTPDMEQPAETNRPPMGN